MTVVQLAGRISGVATPKNPRLPVSLGPSGQRVAARLKELRAGNPAEKVSLRELADRLADLGYPIGADGLSKIETGKRRVDVDDLIALSVALDVSPLALLLPTADAKDAVVQLTPKCAATAWDAWAWAVVAGPLAAPPGDDGEAHWKLQQRSLPPWLQRISRATPFMRRMIEAKRDELDRLSASLNLPDDLH